MEEHKIAFGVILAKAEQRRLGLQEVQHRERETGLCLQGNLYRTLTFVAHLTAHPKCEG